MRCFIAIPINAALSQELAAIQQRLKKQSWAEDVVWFEPQNFHLTLHFVGAKIKAAKVEQVEALLFDLDKNFIGFEVAIQQIELFPDQIQPHTVIAQVAEDARLCQLVQLLEEKLQRIGLQGEPVNNSV